MNINEIRKSLYKEQLELLQVKQVQKINKIESEKKYHDSNLNQQKEKQKQKTFEEYLQEAMEKRKGR